MGNKLSLKTNCDISSIEQYENGKLLKIKLTNGETQIVDNLLCAMGVSPNTSFCAESHFDKSQSCELLVNEYLVTISTTRIHCRSFNVNSKRRKNGKYSLVIQ